MNTQDVLQQVAQDMGVAGLYMEWKGAIVMLEAWQRALQEVLASAS